MVVDSFYSSLRLGLMQNQGSSSVYYDREEKGWVAVEEDPIQVSVTMDNGREVVKEIEENPARFVPFPRLNFHGIMEEFAEEFGETPEGKQLRDALKTKHPFVSFKDAVIKLDLKNDWHSFEANAYDEILADWVDKYLIG